MTAQYISTLLCMLLQLASNHLLDKPSCDSHEVSKVIPKEDCRGYYIYLCKVGVPIDMPQCPEGSSISKRHGVCVPRGSVYDDCSGEVPGENPAPPPVATIEERCQAGETIIPHPTECHQYYNCSHVYTFIPRYFEQYLQECTYPQLFSQDSLQCEPFEKVQCGYRLERVDGCEYIANWCDSSPCLPCILSYPSCKGKSDGMHAYKGRRWSSNFFKCYRERFLAMDTCSRSVDGEYMYRVFDPEKNMCVPLDEARQQHEGTMPAV